MVDKYIEEINRFQTELDKKTQSYLHLKSMKNFLQHYDALKDTHKEAAMKHFKDYFEKVATLDLIDKKDSGSLYWDYVYRLGVMYAIDVKFKVRKILSYSIIWGLVVDIALYLLNVSKLYYYIPLVTIFFIIDWFYISRYYKKNNKVFGSQY
jgi:hypothetical protein